MKRMPVMRLSDRRGTTTQRGYGADWRKVAAQIKRSNPLCVMCAKIGRVTLAEDVDHIVPFVSPEDPRRLDTANLQPLCRACHIAKTAAGR